MATPIKRKMPAQAGQEDGDSDEEAPPPSATKVRQTQPGAIVDLECKIKELERVERIGLAWQIGMGEFDPKPGKSAEKAVVAILATLGKRMK